MSDPNKIFDPQQAILSVPLRDYFAAAALQGSIAFLGMPITRSDESNRAIEAYDMADAMLRAREESDGNV